MCHRPLHMRHRRRRGEQGAALLETIVFFGAVVLLYAAASIFGQRWLAVQQTQHATQAALFDAAWDRASTTEGEALVGERSMDVSSTRELRVGFDDLLDDAIDVLGDLFRDDQDTFPIEPFTAHLLMHDAEVGSTLHPPPDERQGWLAEQPIALRGAMAASTPACWWPHTFLFDVAVGHYTWVIEEVTSLGSFDRPLLNWGL